MKKIDLQTKKKLLSSTSQLAALAKDINVDLQTKKKSLSTSQLAALAKDIKVELDGIADGLRTNMERAIKAGELLIEAKEAVGHGRFCKWCKENFSVSSRTLQKYQQLALYARQANATPTSLLPGQDIAEMGIEAALRYLRLREEELPPAPRTARSDDEEDEAEDPADADGAGKDDEEETEAEANKDRPARRESEVKKWVQGLPSRADNALGAAEIRGDWSRYKDEILPGTPELVDQVIKAWLKVRKRLRELRDPPAEARPASPRARRKRRQVEPELTAAI